MSDPRVACLLVPLFPLAARLRAEPELAGDALVILEGAGDRGRVVAATRRARQSGIKPGATLAQARARLPNLVARGRDASCERAAQEALLDVAESISPRVEDTGFGIAYLDVAGLERHYPDADDPERSLAETLVRELESRAGLPTRVGVGGSKLAARVAAAQPHGPTVIPAGDEADFLAPLPLTRLSPEADILATLERWGIRSVGALARLPRDEVASRLGREGQALHAVARGLDPQPLMPRQPPPVFREGLELEWPLVNLEPFVFVARGALDRLTGRMAGQGLACSCLELSLELEPDGHHERAITLPAPTRDVKTLTTLVRLDLEARPPGAPVRSFVLTAHPDRPRLAQLTLFGPAALSPDKLATTVARLFALLGEGRVGAPQVVDGHRPERCALVPFTPPPPPPDTNAASQDAAGAESNGAAGRGAAGRGAAGRGAAGRGAAGRGLLAVRVLRPPLPLEVITEDAVPAAATATDDARSPNDTSNGEAADGSGSVVHGPPSTARPREIRTLVEDETAKRHRVDGRVRVASGPWGLEEGWWTEAPLVREYWDVEITNGGLYRIYRDQASGHWFADGVYD